MAHTRGIGACGGAALAHGGVAACVVDGAVAALVYILNGEALAAGSAAHPPLARGVHPPRQLLARTLFDPLGDHDTLPAHRAHALQAIFQRERVPDSVQAAYHGRVRSAEYGADQHYSNARYNQLCYGTTIPEEVRHA